MHSYSVTEMLPPQHPASLKADPHMPGGGAFVPDPYLHITTRLPPLGGGAGGMDPTSVAVRTLKHEHIKSELLASPGDFGGGVGRGLARRGGEHGLDDSREADSRSEEEEGDYTSSGGSDQSTPSKFADDSQQDGTSPGSMGGRE